MDIPLPLCLVRSEHSAVVCQQTIDFSLHVRGLRPHSPAAGVALDLGLKLFEQNVATVIPCISSRVDLVGLVDRVDGFSHLPKANDMSAFSSPFTATAALTASKTHCFQCLQIHLGCQSGWDHTGSSRWNKRGNRIGDWHNGDYPGRLAHGTGRASSLTLKSPAP